MQHEGERKQLDNEPGGGVENCNQTSIVLSACSADPLHLNTECRTVETPCQDLTNILQVIITADL